MSTAAAAAPRSAAAALRARGRGGGASASRASPAPAPGRRRSVVVVDRGADDERLVTRRPRRRRLLPLLRATFDDGDGVPFFALSDASRASELRADADAIAALQTRRDAVLLPTTSGKSWVLEVRRARSGAGAGSDADAEDASFAESASFVAAEARLASLPDELLAGRDLSFMGFRGADGAPLFTTDVPSSADDDPMAYATRKAVADNYASMRRQRLQTGASAGEASLADVLSRIRVADAKAVGPMMSRDDAGVLAAAQALTSWQRNNKFCSRCGSPNKLVKSGHKAQCTRINDDKCRGAAYPTLMPAVLTLCTCGEYALLARNSKWPRGFYSCLAGFVDQSESLEQAAAREVIEESGIGIVPGSATYVASQPWPFPCQLMVGFRAEVAAIAVGGEERSDGAGAGEASLPASRSERPSFPARFLSPPNPTLDRNELRDARWFHKDWLRAQLGKNVDPRETPGAGEIPEGEIALPGRHAMARALIERWVEEDENGPETSIDADARSPAAWTPSAVGMESGMPPPLRPDTNRSFAFAVVEFTVTDATAGAPTTLQPVLRLNATGGGGAPTVNDHARLADAATREGAKHGALRSRVIGGGQLCFRGGEVSESAEYDDDREPRLVVTVRNGGGGESGGAQTKCADFEVVAALVRRAYPMHDMLTPGAFGAPGSADSKVYQY